MMKWNEILDLVTEVFAWIQIVISPTLVGVAIGCYVYFTDPNVEKLLIGSLIALAFLVIGILYASHIYKTRGTANFISRVSASPELDNLAEEAKEPALNLSLEQKRKKNGI